MTTPIDTSTSLCECCDKGCPEHEGVSSCCNPANRILFRIDMEDLTGTAMCEDCAYDAMDSSFFTDEARS